MNWIASSPGSAEPDSGMLRSDEVSYLRRVSSGSCMIRWTITGTIGADCTWCSAIVDSVFSGSNLRFRMYVEPSISPSVKCAKPQEWNSGATMNVFSRAFSGIRESSATAGPIVSGCLREAPFGVPVVPLVRITTRPVSSGGTGCSGSPFWIRSSSTGSVRLPSVASGSCQPMKRLRRLPASSSSSVNSSS